jgi:multiple sugar transport system ATP-binding protein
MPVLVLDNVSKSFSQVNGRVEAVRNLSLTLDKNEILVLVGASGCGKTTTLRLIAGLENPDAGTIAIDGNVINGLPAKSRDVAMVFQTPALLPHFTVFENMAFGLKLRGIGKNESETRVKNAAELLGLSDKLNRKPEELSGGEAQRVSLGRALVRQPKIFLLDEPLSNLDPITRKQLRQEILRLHRQAGVPIIYVTHDHREALSLGARIAVMRDGQLQQMGTAEQISKNPANEFVAAFFED